MIKKHVNLGCAEPPLHPQHITLMENIAPLDEWELVDLYVKHPNITNIDAENLTEIPANYLRTIYCSHLLEHISHRRLNDVLRIWYSKLNFGGRIVINVPDMVWAARQVILYETTGLLNGYYDQWEGEHGLQSVIYGNQAHDGEYHKGGFTASSLTQLLEDVGFKDISIISTFEAHDMGVLIAHGEKNDS
jgi:predicted SAM-dependent methyltransferase